MQTLHIPESIEWFIDGHGQAFSRSRSYDLAPFPPPSPVNMTDRRHTGRLRKRDNLLPGEGGKGGWARSWIIRPQESLILYKSFNALWVYAYCTKYIVKPLAKLSPLSPGYSPAVTHFFLIIKTQTFLRVLKLSKQKADSQHHLKNAFMEVQNTLSFQMRFSAR